MFVLFVLHGAQLGLSDDEAYYWVLAQKPALGYAFHPPAVAWCIAFFQSCLGWLFGERSEFLVRLPAAFGGAIVLVLGLNWLELTGLSPKQRNHAAFVLVSFVGYFALAWMMLPDIPLFVGWTGLFYCAWVFCSEEPKTVVQLGLILSTILVLISKYSGILAVGSAVLAILIWAPKRRKISGILALLTGVVVALIPILIWNSQHEWSSLLYQIRERHSGEQISWVRYGRFWLVELFLSGPVLLGYSGWLFMQAVFRWKKMKRFDQFAVVWMLPGALVFCVQPLFSDFKLHWAFVVWWPAVLALAQRLREPKFKVRLRWQVAYGWTVTLCIWMCCYFPIASQLLLGWRGSSFDPRWDMSNDLYGWQDFGKAMNSNRDQEFMRLPVVGSRYQTSSQIAFHLGRSHAVTMLPRDARQKDEWPDLGIAQGVGPEWPRLKTSVLFVGDNRYDMAPVFPDSKCNKIERIYSQRFGIRVKWFDVWRCDPLP